MNLDYTETWLPDPWVPVQLWWEITKIVGVSTIGSGTILANNNDAHYLPMVAPCGMELYSVSFAAANGTGDYDIGIYNSELVRLTSSGATAMTAAGVKTHSFNSLRFKAGELFYAAFSWSSSSASISRLVTANATMMRFSGWGMEPSAHPLPATGTPVTTTAYQSIPLFSLGVR